MHALIVVLLRSRPEQLGGWLLECSNLAFLTMSYRRAWPRAVLRLRHHPLQELPGGDKGPDGAEHAWHPSQLTHRDSLHAQHSKGCWWAGIWNKISSTGWKRPSTSGYEGRKRRLTSSSWQKKSSFKNFKTLTKIRSLLSKLIASKNPEMVVTWY